MGEPALYTTPVGEPAPYTTQVGEPAPYTTQVPVWFRLFLIPFTVKSMKLNLNACCYEVYSKSTRKVIIAAKIIVLERLHENMN